MSIVRFTKFESFLEYLKDAEISAVYLDQRSYLFTVKAGDDYASCKAYTTPEDFNMYGHHRWVQSTNPEVYIYSTESRPQIIEMLTRLGADQKSYQHLARMKINEINQLSQETEYDPEDLVSVESETIKRTNKRDKRPQQRARYLRRH